MRGLVLALVGLIALGIAHVSQASTDERLQYIYMVEAANCVCLPDPRVQTGFRLQGVEGIVTALHGVVGCTHFTARRPGTDDDHTDLRIAYVDIANDVAILCGPTLRGTDGLEAHPTSIPSSKEASVVGHPQAMPRLWDLPLSLESLTFTPLDGSIPPSLQEAVRDRGSPAIYTAVLRLNGDLQPGHSGAPVFDNANRVLGVASGGLGDGTLGLGWAIPMSQIRWDEASKYETYLEGELAEREPSLVFAQSDPDYGAVEPTIWSAGSGCVGYAIPFDLDGGSVFRTSSPALEDADLTLHNTSGEGRELQPCHGSGIALLGNVDFGRVTPELLRRTQYQYGYSDSCGMPLAYHGLPQSPASENQLDIGAVVAVVTGDGRYCKIHITESRGAYVAFDWVTYSLPSEGTSPVAAGPDTGPCGVETWFSCQNHELRKLPGDVIHGFSVEDIDQTKITFRVRYSLNPAHGSFVYLHAFILDEYGDKLGPYMHSTQVSSNEESGIIALEKVSGVSVRYLLVWMTEPLKPDAFLCRQFEYTWYMP